MMITDEFVAEQLKKGKGYTLSFLIEGPNYRTYPEADLQENHRAHLRHLFELKQSGKLLVNGPLMGHGNIRGVSVWSSTDPEEVRGFLSDDPAIKAGRFVFEVYPYFSMPGSTLT